MKVVDREIALLPARACHVAIGEMGCRFMSDPRLKLSLSNLFDHRSSIQGNGAAIHPTFHDLSGHSCTVQMTYTKKTVEK